MSLDQPIARVVSLLEASGYIGLTQPITVRGIPFEFGAMLAGETSLDLVVVIDTVFDNDEDRVRGRVEGLSRALDLARSRRPLTIVVVGPPPSFAFTHSMARVCRVLFAGTPTGTSAESDLRDALAVLLPLELSAEGDGPPYSWTDVREALLVAHPEADATAVFEASAQGAEAVRETLRQVLASPFEKEEP
jgi:hypothetical protein